MFRFSLGNKRIGKVSLHALWCYDVIFRKQIGTFGLSALMFCVVQREAKWKKVVKIILVSNKLRPGHQNTIKELGKNLAVMSILFSQFCLEIFSKQFHFKRYMEDVMHDMIYDHNIHLCT